MDCLHGISNLVLEIRSLFSPAPCKKGPSPAPGSRFYNFFCSGSLIKAWIPAPESRFQEVLTAPTKKARLQLPAPGSQSYKSIYRLLLWLPIEMPVF